MIEFLEHHQNGNSCNDLQEDDESKESLFFARLNTYIFNHLEGGKLSITSLCRDLGISRSCLYRQFDSTIHIPPAHYILLLRLIYAKSLLEIKKFKVGEISFRAGFLDESHFIKVFKRYFGLTPAAFSSKLNYPKN